MDAGYRDEAQAWREWLLRAVAGSPDQVQIMYGIAGERRLTEWEVPWLPGYEGSAPVRIGNAAHGQLQLDVFGEVMDALHQAQVPRASPRARSGWALQQAFLSHLERVWVEPDEGIWEVRGERRALHLFEGHGVGRLRPRDQERRGVRPRRPDRSLAGDCRHHPRRRLPARLRPRTRQLRPVVWIKAAGRQPAADPACRLPAARRCARARHPGGDREAPAGRWVRHALRHRCRR